MLVSKTKTLAAVLVVMGLTVAAADSHGTGPLDHRAQAAEPNGAAKDTPAKDAPKEPAKTDREKIIGTWEIQAKQTEKEVGVPLLERMRSCKIDVHAEGDRDRLEGREADGELHAGRQGESEADQDDVPDGSGDPGDDRGLSGATTRLMVVRLRMGWGHRERLPGRGAGESDDIQAEARRKERQGTREGTRD